MPSRVVFLDRDGTLNVDFGFVCRCEDWQFTDHAPQAIKRLRDAGYLVAVVSNQSGIALGYYTADDVVALHDYAQKQLAMSETKVDAFAFCPHGRDGDCDCRKPRTGLARQIEAELGRTIDYAASWTIGDKISDIQFGQTLGTHTALIYSRYWTADQLTQQPELIAHSLFEIVAKIVGETSDNRREPDETRPAL